MSQIVPDDTLLEDLRDLIAGARQRAASAINRELVLLYWDLGHRIRVKILNEERAEHGARILPTVSAQLTEEFGDGFGKRNLFRVMQLTESRLVRHCRTN